MHSRARQLTLASLLLGIAASSCAAPTEEPHTRVDRSALGQQTIVYVGKQSITNFAGLGQHLQYWPLFGLTSGQTAQRTDATGCIELTPSFANFKHHYLPPGRTFSNDALGNPIGTKTRGGYSTWATFTLPDGTTGRSGTFYDESNVDNSNNTVNEMKIDVGNLTSFCLNLVTDNTNHEHDPNVILEARSDNVNLSLEGNPDLTFDGQTDMYTFRYDGMKEGDVVKIRMQCSSASGCKGAGLGGIMVSDISTCDGSGGPDAGPIGTDAGDSDTGPSSSSSGGASGTDPGAGGGPDAGGSNGAGDATPSAGSAGGCGCKTTDTGREGGSTALLVVAAAALVGLRRRAR